MINCEMAMEIRNAKKAFWRGWKKVSAYTDAENEKNDTCYSWQHYFMSNGRVANWDLFPEITNSMLAAWVIGDETSVFYPDDEEISEFQSIKNFGTWMK